MNVFLEIQTQHIYDKGLIYLELYEVSQGRGDKWPSRLLVDTQKVKVNSLFGTLPSRLYKTQFRMIKRYQKNRNKLKGIDQICSEMKFPRITVSDRDTNTFLSFLK